MVFDHRKNFIMQILEHFQRAGEGIGSWGLVLRTAPQGVVKKGLRGFLSAWWRRHWLVRAGSLNGAARCSKERFARVFVSVLGKVLARGGWFFERRR